jgi:hypothetical protein
LSGIERNERRERVDTPSDDVQRRMRIAEPERERKETDAYPDEQIRLKY